MGNGLTAWRGVNRRWAWLVAGAVVALLLAAGVNRALTAGADERPATVSTVQVDRGAVTTEVATTGTVEPAQTRSLSFAADGTVESVKVRAGTVVTAGQELASIDDTDAAEAVDSAQDTLADAQDALPDAKESATASPDSCGVLPAAYAVPPTTTSSPAPATTNTPSPTRTGAPTRTATPSRTATPARTTPPSRTTAPARPGGAATTCAQGGGANSSGRSSGGRNSGGDPVLSARQRVNQAEVALRTAEDRLAGTTITAPIAGRILSVAGQVGSQVSGGGAFLTLADVFDMQISADFPEADADRLAVAQKATATLAGRAGQDFGATVVQVDPVGTDDGTMVRYGVLLSFTDAPEDLLVGQSAAVRVTTGSADEVLRLPSTAVHDIAGDTGTVLRAGQRVTVGVGLRGDRYTEITSGLAEGAAVARSW
ncbi:efflux RND transporter periplasmic adaptor subunit [Actinoplanes sp. NPDC048967]|uniref:HlyD family efflux transporter periplasmic adaptor subunit n=1 Tax=Actinoplanes sp. NPDC048967 TaxID=3155269 RepID=UPI0033F2C2DA